jgi:hypothetical protein
MKLSPEEWKRFHANSFLQQMKSIKQTPEADGSISLRLESGSYQFAVDL